MAEHRELFWFPLRIARFIILFFTCLVSMCSMFGESDLILMLIFYIESLQFPFHLHKFKRKMHLPKRGTRRSNIAPDKGPRAIPGSWKQKVIPEIFTGRMNSTIMCPICFIRLLMQVLHIDNIISVSQEATQVYRKM